MRASRANALIAEIAVMTAIIMVAAAACCLMFARAHTVSERADALSFAAAKAESAAELFKSGADAQECARLLGASLSGEDELTLGFDEGWKKSEDAARYILKMKFSAEADGMRAADISIRDAEGEEIFALRAERYAGAAA